jgi:hypothetical protein
LQKKRRAADRIHEILREMSQTNKATIAIRRLRMLVIRLQRWMRSCLADMREKLEKIRRRWEHIAARDKTALLKKYNRLHGQARERERTASRTSVCCTVLYHVALRCYASSCCTALQQTAWTGARASHVTGRRQRSARHAALIWLGLTWQHLVHATRLSCPLGRRVLSVRGGVFAQQRVWFAA